jgi:hypothetical protein
MWLAHHNYKNQILPNKHLDEKVDRLLLKEMVFRHLDSKCAHKLSFSYITMFMFSFSLFAALKNLNNRIDRNQRAHQKENANSNDLLLPRNQQGVNFRVCERLI